MRRTQRSTLIGLIWKGAYEFTFSFNAVELVDTNGNRRICPDSRRGVKRLYNKSAATAQSFNNVLGVYVRITLMII
jgi:hypothetical protein